MKQVTDTHFLNVDLDIFSGHDLEGLLDAFGGSVSVLYSGRHGRTYRAHLEVTKIFKTPDAVIREFCRLIDDLPKAARHLWNTAKRKNFNIGIQSCMTPNSSEFVLSTEILNAVTNLGAGVVFTIYAPERREARNRKKPAQ